MKKIILLVTALSFAACSGDSTGPNNATKVTGRWSFAASNLSGGGLSCNVSQTIIQLTQTGSTFTGQTVLNSDATYGRVSCSAGGGSFSDDISASDQIASGVISGTSVSFDIGTSDFHNSGTVSGSTISGQTVMKLNDGTSTVNLVGNFSMVKQ